MLYDQRSRTGMVEIELLENHRGPLPCDGDSGRRRHLGHFERARQQVREKTKPMAVLRTQSADLRRTSRSAVETAATNSLASQPGPLGCRHDYRRDACGRGEMTCRFNRGPAVPSALPSAASTSASSADTVTNLSPLGTVESTLRTIPDRKRTSSRNGSKRPSKQPSAGNSTSMGGSIFHHRPSASQRARPCRQGAAEDRY